MKTAYKTPSMKDLAEKAGVSVSTVSRVLSAPDKDNTTEIQQRVLNLAHKHGYRRLRRKPIRQPNNNRKALSGRIALIAGKHLSAQLMDTDYVYASMINTIYAEAHTAGWEVSIDWADTEQGNILPETVRRGKIDGAILTCLLPDDLIAHISEQVPTVLINSRTYWVDVPCFLIDSYKMIVNAVKYLAEFGHRKIAYLNPNENREAAKASTRSHLYLRECHEGFTRATDRLGLCNDPGLSEALQYDHNGQLPQVIASAMTGWIDCPDPVTAMIIPMSTAPIVLRELELRSLRVPNDVSILVIGEASMSKNMYPPLTTIDIHRKEVPESAMAVLMDGIAGKPMPGQTVLFDPKFIIRQSVARPKQRPA